MSFLIAPDGEFETDLASVPRPFRGWFKQFGPIILPAIGHDWIYTGHVGEMPKSDGDLFFLHACASQGMGKKRFLAYAGVCVGGVGHWGPGGV